MPTPVLIAMWGSAFWGYTDTGFPQPSIHDPPCQRVGFRLSLKDKMCRSKPGEARSYSPFGCDTPCTDLEGATSTPSVVGTGYRSSAIAR